MTKLSVKVLINDFDKYCTHKSIFFRQQKTVWYTKNIITGMNRTHKIIIRKNSKHFIFIPSFIKVFNCYRHFLHPICYDYVLGMNLDKDTPLIILEAWIRLIGRVGGTDVPNQFPSSPLETEFIPEVTPQCPAIREPLTSFWYSTQDVGSYITPLFISWPILCKDCCISQWMFHKNYSQNFFVVSK